MQPLYHHVQLTAKICGIVGTGESLFGMDYKLIFNFAFRLET